MQIERIGGGSLPAVGTPFIASEPPTVTTLLGVSDEYDPLRPNDYESFVKRRKEQRQREREEERRKELVIRYMNLDYLIFELGLVDFVIIT